MNIDVILLVFENDLFFDGDFNLVWFVCLLFVNDNVINKR